MLLETPLSKIKNRHDFGLKKQMPVHVRWRAAWKILGNKNIIIVIDVITSFDLLQSIGLI